MRSSAWLYPPLRAAVTAVCTLIALGSRPFR